MKRCKRALGAALLLFGASTLTQAVAADAQGGYTALGQGTDSCTTWSNHRKAGDWSAPGAWLLGYLTAYNQFVWKGPDIADKNKAEEIYKWMDGYCTAHPLSDLTAAAGQLLVFLDGEHKGAVLQNQLGH